MCAYPGGTVWDHTSRGNDFWLNYLCDLERSSALDGSPNTRGSLLARSATLVLAIGLLAFFRLLPQLFPASERRGRMVRMLGCCAAVASLGVAAFPADRFAGLHPYTISCASLSGFGAVAVAVAALAREGRTVLLHAAAGTVTLVVSVVDLALYVFQQLAGGPGPMALAVLERVALLLVLAWMCIVAIAVLARRATGTAIGIAPLQCTPCDSQRVSGAR
jgi:hypothetical membrane protein